MTTKTKQNWFSVGKAKAMAGTAEIKIYNNIGDYGVTAQDFADALQNVGNVENILLSISSDGGDVSQGFAIFNILSRHPARKTVRVEGLAASMASVITMVGDEIIMPSNAMLMIHNPWGSLQGEAEQIKSFGEALEIMQDNIADAYRDRTGLGKPELLKMMARETWLSAKRSVELGFADVVEDPMKIAASFDVSKFHRVPKSFRAQNAGTKTMTDTNAAKNSDNGSDSSKAKPKSEAQVRKDLLAHASEVRAMCGLAGKPDLADGLIAEDKTLSEVVAALDAAKTKDGKAKDGKDANAELNASNNGTGDGKKAAVVDTGAIYNKWNGRK